MKFKVFDADEHRLLTGVYPTQEAAEAAIKSWKPHRSTNYFVVFEEKSVWPGDKLLAIG